jgi:hypothetical protein
LELGAEVVVEALVSTHCPSTQLYVSQQLNERPPPLGTQKSPSFAHPSDGEALGATELGVLLGLTLGVVLGTTGLGTLLG